MDFLDKVKAISKTAWAFIKKTAKRFWAYLKVAKMEYIILASVFAFDLISKALAAKFLFRNPVYIIPSFFQLYYHENNFTAFGASWLTDALGPMGARIFLSILSFVSAALFIFVLARAKGKSKLFRISLALVTAGALGNGIDRAFLGYVRDFIRIVYFGYSIKTEWIQTVLGTDSFPIFNIADSALVIGVILMVVYFIFFYKDKEEKHLMGEGADQVAVGTVDVAVSEPVEPAAPAEAVGERQSDEGHDDEPDGQADEGQGEQEPEGDAAEPQEPDGGEK